MNQSYIYLGHGFDANGGDNVSFNKKFIICNKLKTIYYTYAWRCIPIMQISWAANHLSAVVKVKYLESDSLTLNPDTIL